jgi:hypothetical protein
MDVQITVITGGGKKANRESKSYTIKEVATRQQVIEALDEKFGQYFVNQTTIEEVKPRSKKNSALIPVAARSCSLYFITRIYDL